MATGALTMPLGVSFARVPFPSDPVCCCGHGHSAHDYDEVFACAACASIHVHGDGCPAEASCRALHRPLRPLCRAFHL